MSTLRVDTIQNASGTDSPINVPGTAKAWVNFNGTGTVAIRASYNVSSITDNGVGSYAVNFTNALSDTNYSTVLGAVDASNGTNRVTVFLSGTLNTTSVGIYMLPYTGAVFGDASIVNVAIFR